jgi:hypothetical protein
MNKATVSTNGNVYVPQEITHGDTNKNVTNESG